MKTAHWLSALAAALLLVQTAFADTLVDNVNGYTLDSSGKLVSFTGLVIDDSTGSVKQLLMKKDKRPERPSYRQDGRGRTLIPGFIDGHGHVMALGLLAARLDLSQTASLAEAQAKLSAFAAANPNSRWIVGGGWDQDKWQFGRFPTASELDVVVPDRPVWLERIDGNAGWANSAAMKEAGIGPGAAVPSGGRIEMIGKQPSGIFIGSATALMERVVPPPLPRARDQALARTQQIALGFGLTTVTDMGTDIDGWMAMRRAGDRNALQIRIISYASSVDTVLTVAGTGPTPWLYDGHLRMVGVHLESDGALGSRGAWLKADYRDAPGQRGSPVQNDATLKNWMSRAAMDNFQVAVRAVGDAANAQLLGALDELSGTYRGDRRWRIEQAQIVDPIDLPRFARNGTIASMQPAAQASNWPMVEARLGVERLSSAFAWGSMIRNKVPLAFGSGFPAESANPFAGLAAAISREDAQGRPAGGWMPQEKVSLVEALAGFTSGAAYAAFADDRLGTLEKGKQADFLFIDRDIFAPAASQQQIRSTQVLETWIAGRKVWQKGPASPQSQSR